MKNIALIYGGEGRERDISRASAKSLYELIDKDKYRVIPVFISKEGNWYISESSPFSSLPTKLAHPTFPIRLHGVSGLLSNEKILKIDCAIPILHGDFGEDGIIQGVLRATHIPFIGADVCESAICIDKIYTKYIARATGIATADFLVGEGRQMRDILAVEKEVMDTLGFPVFIKPARLGSSIGAMAVRNEDEFLSKYAKTLSFGSRVLIEKLIDVDYEIECALFSKGDEKFFSSGIIKTCGKVYDFDEKYTKNNIETSVAEESSDAILQAEEYARQISHAIGLSSISRIDFLVDRSGKIYFNEINTMPGMTKASLYPRLTEAMGFKRGEFLSQLISEVLCDGDI